MDQTGAGGESAEVVRALMTRKAQTLEAYLKLVASRKGGGRSGEVVGISDLVQETILAALRQLDLGKGPKSEQKVEHWLRDRLLDIMKQKRRVIRRVKVELDVEPADSTTSPGGKVIGRERAVRLHEALGRLDEERRQFVVLRCVEGLSLAEIAQRLDRGVPFVRKTLAEALLTLRVAMREWDDEVRA